MILYLKSISLGRHLKIKKGKTYNIFSFVQQVWAYCNIKELKDILYYFVFSFAHMCSFSFPPKDYCRRQKQIVFRCTGRPTNSTIFLQSALFHKIQLLPPPFLQRQRQRKRQRRQDNDWNTNSVLCSESWWLAQHFPVQSSATQYSLVPPSTV